jgi:hypothetical protein
MSGKITTIIPTFRRPKSLLKAIRSVLAQTYPDFEIHIYDNASGDSTADLVRSLQDPRIRYFCHPRNIGAVQNFQFGLSRVQTPFFSFLSDDDYLLPSFYETALQGFEKHPTAGLSLTAVLDVSEKGKLIDCLLDKWPAQDFYSAPDGLLQIASCYSNWTGALMRKEIIDTIGPLDPNLKAIDVDYLLRIAAQFPITLSKKPCAVFVQHSASYSASHGLKVIWPTWQLLIDKVHANPNLPKPIQLKAAQILTQDLKVRLLRNILRALEKSQFDEARQMISLLTYCPSAKKLQAALPYLTTACSYFPPFQMALTGLLRLRRNFKSFLNRVVYKQVS